MGMKRHLSILVSGRVQGVFYRASAKAKADELGISGFVQNMPDGKVYIEVEGPDEKLDHFKTWCSKGPPRAQVEQVEIKEGDVQDFTSFGILR
jgi:acylphosphatase